jgi:hypothetical protein
MEALQWSFQRVWADIFTDIIAFIPVLIISLIVLIVGLIIASLLGWIVEKAIRIIRLDLALKRTGLETYLNRANLRLDSGRFFGRLAYWFVVILTVLGVSDILRLWQVSEFLRQVIIYLPRLMVAILIMLAAILLAKFLKSLVRASVLAAKLHASKFLGALTWWVIIILGIVTVLNQLGIATTIVNFVNYLAIGLIAMLAIAGGVAFGLGGKDYASYLLGKIREETEEK